MALRSGSREVDAVPSQRTEGGSSPTPLHQDIRADQAFICDKCHKQTRLVMVSIGLRSGTWRMRSECCRYTVKPTKARELA